MGEKTEAKAPRLGGPGELWLMELFLGNVLHNIDYSKPVKSAEKWYLFPFYR